MKSLVDALQKENMRHDIGRNGVKAGKKVNKKANAKNPATKGSVGQKGKFLHLIGAS